MCVSAYLSTQTSLPNLDSNNYGESVLKLYLNRVSGNHIIFWGFRLANSIKTGLFGMGGWEVHTKLG